MPGQQQQQPMTLERFFAWQLKQQRLYELVDGVPVLPLKMMIGTTRRHDRIVVNAITAFMATAKDTQCWPWTDAVAVKIPKGNLRRPDVTLDCGVMSDSEQIAACPRLVIEVLSPSTMSFDRLVKLGEYKTVPSLNWILLVDTEQPRVTVHERRKEIWQPEYLIEGLDGVLQLDDLGMKLHLANLFDGIEFEGETP